MWSFVDPNATRFNREFNPDHLPHKKRMPLAKVFSQFADEEIMRCFLESRLEMQRGGPVFRNIFKPYEVEMKTYSCQLARVLIDEQAKRRLGGNRAIEANSQP